MKCQRQVRPLQQLQHQRKLHQHHAARAHHRSPSNNHGERKLRIARAESPERGDHRHVPDHWGGIGKKKSPMAVQNSQAPRRKDQEARARKKDAHNANGQLTLFAVKSGSNRVDQIRRGQNADQHQNGSGQRQQGRNGARCSPRFFIVIARQQRRIDRNEGSGENTFAKQILQRIGNAEGRLKRVRGIGIAEIMGKNAFANQPRDPAQKDSGSDEKRRALRGKTPGHRCPRAAHEEIVQIAFIVSRYPLQEQQGGKSMKTVRGCAVRVGQAFSLSDLEMWPLSIKTERSGIPVGLDCRRSQI